MLAGSLAVATGCAPAAPSVSEKVQQYYDENVASKKTGLPTPPAAKKVVVIGDSYAAGTGAANSTLGWVSRLASNQQWALTNLARGGTGYKVSVTTNAQKACSLDYCPSFPEMIKDAAGATPDLVIVAGGRNDATIAEATESVAIRDFFTQLRAAVPGAQIVAFNPLWDDGAAPSSIAAIAAAVQGSVTDVGGEYLDASQPLAGHPELVAPDGIHPNPAGHAAIFEANLKALQSAGIAAR